MTEEMATPAKKARGWPKGKPRGAKTAPTSDKVQEAADRAELRAKAPKSLLLKMKAAPNWESEDFQGVGQDEVDRLRVPPDILFALHKDGVALQWATKSVRGQETPQEYAKFTKSGWTPVHQSDFDGVLDGIFMPRGQDEPIVVDDCILMARPTAIQSKSKMNERRNAVAPLQTLEQSIGRTGIAGATGAGHPGALRGNHITKHLETIQVPSGGDF